MSTAILDAGTGRSVMGTVIFATGRGEKPVNETFEVNLPIRKRTGETESHRVPIVDGRPFNPQFSIETNGFKLVEHRTTMRDFFDPEELKATYYPEIERLVKEVSGASRCSGRTTTTPTGRVRSVCAISCPMKRRSCSSVAWRSSRCGARSRSRSW